MKLYTPAVFFSVIIATAVSLPLLFLLQPIWMSPAVLGGVVILGYILAAVTARGEGKVSESFRGLLIGINTSLNCFIGYTIAALFLPVAAAITYACILGTINFLCAFKRASQNGFFQGIVGWLNWVMPMSWPIVVAGFLFLLVTVLLALVTGFQAEFLKIKAVKMDWSTGTFFIKGGLVSNLNYAGTAFNMGNFSFVHKDYEETGWAIDHEAGHSLNLSAFGFIFHLIGALDENALGRGENAYAERLAESNEPGSSRPKILMWV